MKRKLNERSRKLLVVVLIILLLLLCGLGFLFARYFAENKKPDTGRAGFSWVRSIYGFGDTLAEMTAPSGAAIDPGDGSVWVTDPSKRRIVHYNLDGTYRGQIYHAPNTKGALRLPTDIAIDSDGILYVVEPTYNVIRVFDQEGSELGSFDVPGPLSIAVNDNYIVVGANSGFAVYSKLGNVIKVVGKNGRKDNEFDKVNGIAIDENNNIYVVDTFNNRLGKYQANGTRIWQTELGYPGNEQETGKKIYPTTAPSRLQVPMGITLDANGHVVLVDMFDFCIARFSQDTGKFIDKMGEVGLEDGSLMYPADIDYDYATGQMVVSDTGASRLQVFNVKGSGGSQLSAVRSYLGTLALCCIPLLIILLSIMLALTLLRRGRHKELVEAELDTAVPPPGDVAPEDSSTKQ